jgi:ABC-2 type transport system permease protein
MIIFGTNDLVVFKEDSIHLMNHYDVLWRFFAAFVFAALALTMIAALALMLSAFAENSIGPIVITVFVVVVFTIIEQLRVPVFKDTIIPYSFTSHMLGWKGFFYVVTDGEGNTIDGSVENISAVIKSALILIGYIILFLLITTRYFRKKEILS